MTSLYEKQGPCKCNCETRKISTRVCWFRITIVILMRSYYYIVELNGMGVWKHRIDWILIKSMFDTVMSRTKK